MYGQPPAGYPSNQQGQGQYPGQQQQQYGGQNQQYGGQSQQYPQQQQGGYGQAQQQYPPQQQQQYPPQQQGGYGQAQNSYPPAGGDYNRPQTGQYPPAGWQGGGQSYPGQSQGYGQQQQAYPGQAQGGFGQQQGMYGGQQQGYGGPHAPVVGQQYCSPGEQVYLLKEKLGSLSGDDFTIVNPNDQHLGFKLDSSSMSMRGARKLKTLAGNHVILHMKHQLMGKTWYMYRGGAGEDLIAEIKGPGKMEHKGAPPHAEVYLKGNTSQHFSRPAPDFSIQGDVRGKSFVIRRQQQMVAEVSRQLAQESSSVRLTGKDSYALRVFPGQDAAFIVAVVTLVDELFYD